MKTQIFIAGAMILLASTILNAQDEEGRFGFEISGGPSFSTKKLAGSDLKPGGGFEMVFHYKLIPQLGAYGGWGWNHFSTSQSFLSEKTSFVETGYVMGLQHKRPIASTNMDYYVRAGALYNHIEVENKSGDIVSDTGHGWGWQMAAGIELPLGTKWHLTPGLKYNSLSRTLDEADGGRDLNLNYLSLRVGFLRKF